MSLSVGDILQGRYRIDGFLKRGGMGAVYKAWDTALDMPVAVKENTIETSTEAEKQFEREARILARLHHPNLPRVTNHFIIDNQGQYLVMDLVEGDRLDDNRCVMPLSICIARVRQLFIAILSRKTLLLPLQAG
jgi:serine/threonine protein kinase